MGLPNRLKEHLYPLVLILGELVTYKNGLINLKIELIQVNIKGWEIIINFNILLLGQNKAVFKIL